MVKKGDIVEFKDEFNQKINAKVIEVFTHDNTKETLTLQYKSKEGFQREVGTICHVSEREDGADGNKINCYDTRGSTKADPPKKD